MYIYIFIYIRRYTYIHSLFSLRIYIYTDVHRFISTLSFSRTFTIARASDFFTHFCFLGPWVNPGSAPGKYKARPPTHLLPVSGLRAPSRHLGPREGIDLEDRWPPFLRRVSERI